MNIAVFADLHGRLLLAFKLCARWQQETGKKIDLILQAGDLGAYPAMERLDRATRRYAERDPTELGFMEHFVRYDARVAALLAETDCPLVFVRGNHEDHAWLDELEGQHEGAIFPFGTSHPFLSIVVFPERNPPTHRLLVLLEIHRCLPHLLSVFLSAQIGGPRGEAAPGNRPALVSQTNQPPALEAFSASLQAAGRLDRPPV